MPSELPSVDAIVIAGADVLVGPGDLRPSSDLLISGGVVEAIVPTGGPRPAGAEVLDASGMLAMPGLVNAHTHSPENRCGGLADGLRLEPWLAHLTAAGGVFDEDDHYWCALAGAAEMLLCGTTSVIDHVAITSMAQGEVDGAMRAYRDAGIRGGVAPLLIDGDCTADLARSLGVAVEGPALVPGPAPPRPAAELIAFTDEARRRWHGAEGGRLHVLAGPSGVQWCSDEMLAGMAQTARAHGTNLQIHLDETRLQAAANRLRFGCSATEALDRLGVLGPDVSLAHCVWLDEADIELVAARGAVVAHNPAANLRLRSGRAPIPELLAAGATVAVGTDGAASSDDQGTWFAMRLAAMIHRGPDEWVSGPQALAMATTGGGRALGVEGLGTLAPGSPADVALLDQGAIGLAGAHDLETALVLSETGAGVRHVIVGGEVVVRDGRPARFDLDEVLAALAEQCARRRGPADPALEAVTARVEEVYAALTGVRSRLERPGVPTRARPRSLREALDARAADPDAVVIAGGTGVMVELNRGAAVPRLLDLSRVEELASVDATGLSIRLGARVTYTRVIEELAGPLPGVATAARTIAGRQIRNRATLAGALVLADPSSDVLAPLVAAGAEIELTASRRVRTVPAERFVLGPGHADIAPDELVTAILVPAAEGPVAYAKAGARNAMARAVCGVAVQLRPATRSLTVAVVGVAPRAVRPRAAEALLAGAAPWDDDGAPLPAEVLDAFAALVAEAIDPAGDDRGSAAHRRRIAGVLARRAAVRAWSQR